MRVVHTYTAKRKMFVIAIEMLHAIAIGEGGILLRTTSAVIYLRR